MKPFYIFLPFCATIEFIEVLLLKGRNDMFKALRLRSPIPLIVAMGMFVLTAGNWAPTPAPAASPATKPADTQPAAPRIAHIRITGEVQEAPPSFSLLGDTGKNKTLREWLNRLAKARQDDQVAAVAIEFDQASVNWSQASEFADSIRRLRDVKPVYAFLVGGGISQYIVLSSATEVAMEPAGDLEIVGLAAEMTFYRGTLDKLGIVPQMVQVGKFKGAQEPFMSKEPSEELKGEYNKLLDDLYNQLISQVASNRKLKPPDVREAIDHGPFDARLAKRYELVDTLVERSKWEDHVGKKASPDTGKYIWVQNYGQEPKKQLDMSNPFALLNSLFKQPEAPTDSGPIVAIVTAEGTITSGSSGEGFLGGSVIGDRTMVKALKEAAANEKIKAVVVRINSPGGSALASEMIYQAIRDCAIKKPVIASIAGMGASGGYYIALGAPTIYADPTAIVGSIGVVSGKIALDIPRTPDGKEGLYQKLGISTYAMTRGKNAGLELSRPWTDEELETIRTLAQKTYDQFTTRVAESRGKRVLNVSDVAQGRIFTAKLAVANGLVDKIGGMREAVEAARKAAGITGGTIITLPKPKTLADLFTDDTGASSPDYEMDQQMRLLMNAIHPSEGMIYLLNLCRQFQKAKVLMAMPYYVQIKG